jgi:hypothetical protein
MDGLLEKLLSELMGAAVGADIVLQVTKFKRP